MIRELPRKAISGLSILVLLLPVSVFAILGVISAARADAPGRAIGFLLLFMLVMFLLVGLFTVQPNEARVLQLFGDYNGTVKRGGLPGAQSVLHEEEASRSASGTSRPRSSR